MAQLLPMAPLGLSKSTRKSFRTIKPTKTGPNRTNLIRFGFGFVYIFWFFFGFGLYGPKPENRPEPSYSVLTSISRFDFRFEFFLSRFSVRSVQVGFDPMLTLGTTLYLALLVRLYYNSSLLLVLVKTLNFK